MKKATLLCGMLLAITASVASAGPGLNLRWNACFGDGGVLNKAFACNSNTIPSAHQMVGSFEVPAVMLGTSGLEVVIDLASGSATLPAWWQFKNAGTCRTNSMTMNFTISLSANACADWAPAGASGGIGAYNIGQRGPNTARIVAAIAVPATGLSDLFPGQEYFAYNILLNNAKTVGTGACAGCQTGVCIEWNSCNVTNPNPALNRRIVGPTNGTDSDFCTWQGPVAPTVGSVIGCNAAVPTRNTTWGAVKTLYR